jgi:hypothetical protein
MSRKSPDHVELKKTKFGALVGILANMLTARNASIYHWNSTHMKKYPIIFMSSES